MLLRGRNSLLLVLIMLTSQSHNSHNVLISSTTTTTRTSSSRTERDMMMMMMMQMQLGVSNAGRGSNITGLSHLKTYLSRFGYLLHKSSSTTDEFDAIFESALITYQRKLGLQVTGKLDSNTLSQMITPRCGLPDHDHDHDHTPLHSTNRFLYFPGKPRWSRAMPITLTYAFSPEYTIHTLTMFQIRKAFQRAFHRWAKVIPVTFLESQDYAFAEIKIGFYSGDHGDGEPFDGVLGVLAHSFSPESGRLHLDAAETWAVDFSATESEVAVDLESVATHEIGHVLGLSHSSDKGAVMYPSLRPRDKRADLNKDDIKGVQSLYGSNPNFRSQWALQSDISSNPALALHFPMLNHSAFTLAIALFVFSLLTN